MKSSLESSRLSRWGSLICLGLIAGRSSAQFNSAISPCPVSCDLTGSDSSAWTFYHDFGQLDACNGTVLFQTNIYNKIDDPNTHVYFRACTASGGTIISDPQAGITRRFEHSNNLAPRQALAINDTAPSAPHLTSTTWNDGKLDVSAAKDAIEALQSYAKATTADTAIIFAQKQSVVAGMYIGSQIDKSSAGAILGSFGDQVGQGNGQRSAIQTCDAANISSTQYFGAVTANADDVATVQDALRSWNEAQCVNGDSRTDWNGPKLTTISGTDVSVDPKDVDGDGNGLEGRSLHARDTCKYTQVQAGDGCYAVAQRCGCTQDELASYNGGGDFCSTLKVDQYVCCSPGDPPDFSPQPNSDGTCAAYTIQSGDYCQAIADAHSMTVEDLQNRNQDTWGWQGCGNIFLGMKICLSTGRPPFPAVVPNAVCGPQVNGTEPTSDVSGWTNLNQCPLNACCDIFGQCGITSDFCTPNPADTGNPGTAQPGSNGCISNCGTDIISGASPSTFENIGYYEAFSVERPCDHLSVGSIPDRYTIVHWAFADLSDSFQPSISPYEDAWADFKKETRFKRIVSFGGWEFSTAPSSFDILRESVKPANRQTFANNVAQFVQDEGLDGVDIDWEYPGAPDSQGEPIPLDSPDSADNYLEFLKLLRDALPSKYSISIAIPASFYYLKAFPADKLGDVLDYFIYMTYDLHGQWDYGNSFTNPGCPNGNCLRSQINQTETESALSMLTKAGVDSSKIMLGQPLYGRSFKMTDPSCYTADCTFTGPSSGARPGNCTGTPGYIANLEIRDIINGGQFDVQQYSSNEAGDILVYDGNWVSWMSDSTYYQRLEYARGLGLGGTSDWAIDLNYTGNAGGNGGGNDGNGTNGGGSGVVTIDPSIYGDPNPSVTCQPPCTFVFPPWTLPYTTTIAPPPVTSSIVDYWPYVTTISGSTSTFYVSKTTVTTITPKPVTTTEIPVSNVEWTNTDDSIIILTSSVILPPVTLTQDSTVYTTDDMTTTIPGITYKYSQGPYPPVTMPSASATTTSPAITGNPTSTDSGSDPTSSSTYGIFPPPTSCDRCPPTITPIIGPPGPICQSGCGIQCLLFCSPDLPCIGPQCNCIGIGCPGGGGCVGPGCSGSDDDQPDPEDPEDPEDEGEDTCEIETSTGLCDNGNFPVFDPQTGQISCDGSMEPGECQQRVDNDMQNVKDYIENEQGCCPAESSAKVRRREANGIWTNMFHDVGALFKRQGGGSGAGSSCPQPGQPGNDPKNPPQGQCVVTYTCPGDQFPNVCGNAKSAIQDRHMTNILTHHAGSKLHKTLGWKNGHYMGQRAAARGGWKLQYCEVEEYPFGSGNPDRRADNPREWDQIPSLRLIPGGPFNIKDPSGAQLENQRAANHLTRWLAQVRRDYSLNNIDGIVYCVDFESGFTNYLPEQTENYCAVPYGPEFTLVNGIPVNGGGGGEAAAPELRWDPWFNQQVGRRNYQFIMNDNNGQGLYANIPPAYCPFPSPGNMVQSPKGSGMFQLESGFQELGRGDSDPAYIKCTDVPGANTKRDVQAMDPSTAIALARANETARIHARHLLGRQGGGGGFLDAAVYRYFGCGDDASDEMIDEEIADDNDPCYDAPYCNAIYPPYEGADASALPAPEESAQTRTGPSVTSGGPSTATNRGGDGGSVGGGGGTTSPPSTTSCFVPGGCQNVAAPTGCAVLCDAPTTTSTSTHTLPPAPTDTSTDPRDGNFGTECFDPEDNPDHLRFIWDDYVQVTKSFCDQNYVLGAGNTFGYVEQYAAGDHRTQVYASWADDQSGCGDKADFAFSSEDHDSDRYNACRNVFIGPYMCHRDGGDSDGKDTSYGGYYVYNSSKGCIRFEIYALALQSGGNQKRIAPSFLKPNTTADNPRAGLPNARGYYNGTTLLWINSNRTSTFETGFGSPFNVTEVHNTTAAEKLYNSKEKKD